MLARRANLTSDEVYRKLKKLSQMKIIHYIPQRKLPVITYETERINGNRIHISPENYQYRKLHYQQQVDHVISYASQKEECRVINILKYFGQLAHQPNLSRDCGISTSEPPCGNCDVCMGEHESGISSADFDRVSDKIKSVLSKESLTINQIIQQVDEHEKAIISVSRWMLDNGMIVSDRKGLLSLKQNRL